MGTVHSLKWLENADKLGRGRGAGWGLKIKKMLFQYFPNIQVQDFSLYIAFVGLKQLNFFYTFLEISLFT